MTELEFQEQYLGICLKQALLLQELNESKEIEPEQKRRNVATILSVLHDALDLCKEIDRSAENPAQAQD